MMIMRRVWNKTAKGEEEMCSRTYGLAPSLRCVLILVDGVSDDRKLLQKGAYLTYDIPAGLTQLALQGYIQAEVESLTIDNAKKELIRIAQETLGTAAEKVVEIVRQAPDNKDGLMAALSRCKKLVKMIIDEKKADALNEKCSAVLAEIP
jgi:hypothetical protein